MNRNGNAYEAYPTYEAMVRQHIDTAAYVSVATPLSQIRARAATRYGTARMQAFLVERGADTTIAGWGNQTPLRTP
jgi:hypothetical protein